MKNCSSLLCYALCALSFVGNLQASQPGSLKLYPPTSPGHSGGAAGTAVATSEKYTLVGAPNDSVSFNNGGAVHVFDAISGKRVRTLRPAAADGGAEEKFGSAIAISGTYALIGAPGDDNFVAVGAGSVYLFDLVTGKQLLRTVSGVGTAGEAFGASVAFEGNYAAVGAPGDDAFGTHAGSVWVLKFDLVGKTVLSNVRVGGNDTDADDALGTSVAIQGSIVLAGAPGANSNKGGAYLFSIPTSTQISKVEASDGVANDAFGTSVAMCGSLMMIGAPGAMKASELLGAVYVMRTDDRSEMAKLTGEIGQTDTGFGEILAASGDFLLVGAPHQENGTVHVFHTSSGELLAQLTAPDAQVGYDFGASVGLLGNAVVVGATGIDLPGSSGDGGGYLYTALATEVGSEIVLETKSPAAEVYDATYNVLTSFTLASDGAPVTFGTLAGAGAVSGTTTALWRQIAGYQRLKLRTGDLLDALKVTSMIQTLPTAGTAMICQVKGSGTGITSVNDVGIYNTEGASGTFIREGDELTTGGLSGQKINVMGQMVTSDSASRVAFYTTLKTGTATVTSSNDSAIILQDFVSASTRSTAREGDGASSGLLTLGQITARPTYASDRLLFPAALVAATNPVTTADNAALLTCTGNNAAVPGIHARKGFSAGVTGGLYSAFLGESLLAADDTFIYRATMTGVPTTENEAIWRGDGVTPALQEGKENAGLPTGVKISKFLRYWLMNNRQVLAHVTLIGTGVTAANDGAIVRLNGFDVLKVLARESDYAPGCAGVKYSVFQEMDADPTSGMYGFVSSLTGGAAAANQAFFSGSLMNATGSSGADAELQMPRMQLRKGTIQALFGTTTTITSIDMTLPVDTTGSGFRGLGSCVRGNHVAMVLTLANGKKMALNWEDPIAYGGNSGSP
ncbi:MAG: hypothetical protein JNJ83_21835 [Verrucomicrobiaceae bacterium]|nr:hypothetical protein [Verrucomicrobiaceae bacterium]